MNDKIKIRRPDGAVEEVLCVERNGALVVARVETTYGGFTHTVTHEPTGTSLFHSPISPDLARGVLRALAAQDVDWTPSDPGQLRRAIRSNGPCFELINLLHEALAPVR